MFRKRLKLKLVAGALGLIVIVSMAITIVVAVIVNRQNRTMVNVNLETAMAIVRDDFKERTARTAASLDQMVAANEVGGKVKFLCEFAEDELTISHSAYQALAAALRNQLNSSALLAIGIYDLNGDLMVFAERSGGDQCRYGFRHQALHHVSEVALSATASDDEWQQERQWNGVTLSDRFDGVLPAGQETAYLPVGDHLSIRVNMPMIAMDYDDNGDEILKPFGTLVATKLLNDEVVTRLARLTGMEVNLFLGERLSIGSLPDHATLEAAAVPKPSSGEWRIDTQAVQLGETRLEQGLYFSAVLPIIHEQHTIGAVSVLQSDQVVRANNRRMLTVLGGVALVCILLCTPLTLLAVGAIVRQISGVVARLKDIAEGDGDLTKRLDVKSQDEIGQLATWFNAFIDNIHSIIREVKGDSEKLHHAASDLTDIAGLMADGAAQTSDKADGVASSGLGMSASMQTTAATMADAAEKVHYVAEAADALNATFADITQNTGTACTITSQAVDQAEAASKQVAELGQAATDIGNVIDAITEISDQVNLLALNATIESARAGEAGKGFAVVANEIKELARQTAMATGEIRGKVEGIQNSTDGTIQKIGSITQVVNEVNDIVSTITAAVEEQSVTTGNIAEKVQQVADGIGTANQNVSTNADLVSEMSSEIQTVTGASAEMTRNSSQVKHNAENLSDLAGNLTRVVDQFKV